MGEESGRAGGEDGESGVGEAGGVPGDAAVVTRKIREERL